MASVFALSGIGLDERAKKQVRNENKDWRKGRLPETENKGKAY